MRLGGRASESEVWRKGAGKQSLEEGCRSEAWMKGAGK